MAPSNSSSFNQKSPNAFKVLEALSLSFKEITVIYMLYHVGA